MHPIVQNILKPQTKYVQWLVLFPLLIVLILDAFGYFYVIRDVLDAPGLTVTMGDIRFSPYTILKAILAMTVLFWITSTLSNLGLNYIQRLNLRSSNRTLLHKIYQIGLYFIGTIVLLDMCNVDLTTLRMLSGAIGIGVGFGLQKIAANFISGIILLFEKSVEENDLIELQDGTYCYVRQVTARYTRVETFDGRDIMIPNEAFIVNPVINLTHTNAQARVEITILVDYATRLSEALERMVMAAQAHPRCSSTPAPEAYASAFHYCGIELTLHFWIDDVTQGRMRPKSDVMSTILSEFHTHGIIVACTTSGQAGDGHDATRQALAVSLSSTS